MRQHWMPEIPRRTHRAKRRLTTAVPFLVIAWLFIVLVGGSQVREKRAMLRAPTVDISEVHSRCGQVVEVEGWVNNTESGYGYYFISREKTPDPIDALHYPGHTFSAHICVLAGGAEARRRPSPETGTLVKVQGLVVCHAEGAIQLVESERAVSDRP